jgi:ribokinase
MTVTRVAVVGHVEWVEFVRVPRYPRRGGLEQGVREFEHAGGGAVVAAAVLAELGARVDFLCAVGDDDRGHAAMAELEQRGVTVHTAWRSAPTRYVFTLLDDGNERTIITVGERLAPSGDDDLGWELLSEVDGVYVTAGDGAAIRRARAAPVMTASPRAGEPVPGVTVDAMVLSATDEHERDWAASWERQSRVMVATEGSDGGRWWGESEGRWAAAAAGEPRDSYGCGDAFAAGVTYGLAAGMEMPAATEVGARWGARMLTRVGAP